jgi:hypothetical protein
MRRYLRLMARCTLVLLAVIGFSVSHQPPNALAKTVLPVDFGDPTDTVGGPAPGPGKGSAKELSSGIQTPAVGTLGSHSGLRILLTENRYFLILSILKTLYR